jgi:hypothetical protein
MPPFVELSTEAPGRPNLSTSRGLVSRYGRQAAVASVMPEGRGQFRPAPAPISRRACTDPYLEATARRNSAPPGCARLSATAARRYAEGEESQDEQALVLRRK